MSSRTRNTITLARGRILIEGFGWDGERYAIVFHRFQAMEADAISYSEETEDEIIYGDNQPLKILSTPPNRYLDIENLRLLRDEERGDNFMLVRHLGENPFPLDVVDKHRDEEEVRREHRQELAEYFESNFGVKGLLPLHIHEVVEILRSDEVSFGEAEGDRG